MEQQEIEQQNNTPKTAEDPDQEYTLPASSGVLRMDLEDDEASMAVEEEIQVCASMPVFFGSNSAPYIYSL